MAAASGWVLWRSRAAAVSRTSSREGECAAVGEATASAPAVRAEAVAASATVSTALTVGSFRVRVPVLSKATWRISPKRSNAAPDFTTTPRRLAAPMAEMTVTGTEMAKAQGDAATSTTSARSIHVPGSPKMEPMAATATARMSTPGTSGRAMRSATRARPPLSCCARSTRATTSVSELPEPGAVARASMASPALMVPARRAPPSSTATGMDSPVTADASMVAVAPSSVASVGIRSPARMSRTSPGTMSSTGMSRCDFPPQQEFSTSVACSGSSFSSDRRPRRARCIALSSRASAME